MKLGAVPTVEPERSTAEMTLLEILTVKGKIDLSTRKRFILDGLSCSTAVPSNPEAMDDAEEDQVDVEKLAPVVLAIELL